MQGRLPTCAVLAQCDGCLLDEVRTHLYLAIGWNTCKLLCMIVMGVVCGLEHDWMQSLEP